MIWSMKVCLLLVVRCGDGTVWLIVYGLVDVIKGPLDQYQQWVSQGRLRDDEYQRGTEPSS